MKSIQKVKFDLKAKPAANLAFVNFLITFALIGPMLYQCVKLCIEFFDEPLTTNIFVQDVNQSSFLSKLQICFHRENMMNITRAKNFRLQDSHQFYLQNFFHPRDQKNFTPKYLFDNFSTEISFEFEILKIFDFWDGIENEIVTLAENFLNSSNLMEFWNFNNPENLLPVRFAKNFVDTKKIFGPYVAQPSWGICYDIPPSSISDFKDFVQFNFNYSTNCEQKMAGGSVFFSFYIGDSVVFESNELKMIEFDKDSKKCISDLENVYTVDIKKFIALNKRNKKCIEDKEVKSSKGVM